MKRAIVTSVILFLAYTGYAQESEKIIPVHIKAILLDRDLNQKPAGKSKFTIISVEAQPPSTIGITTSFNGSAELSLAPGKYRIVSVQPLDFQGKRYSWNVELNVAAPATTIELSNDNAIISNSPTSAASVLSLVRVQPILSLHPRRLCYRNLWPAPMCSCVSNSIYTPRQLVFS